MVHPEEKKIINRLRRMQGQLRGIEKMVDRQEEFEKVLIQIAAVHSATHALKKMYLQYKMETHFDYFAETQDIDHLIEMKKMLDQLLS